MLLEVSLALITLCLLAYFYITQTWSYFADKNVFYIKPSFPGGSIPELLTKSKSLIDVFKSHFAQTLHLPYYGVYFMRMKFLVINDLDLMKQIMVKDFDHFVDRVEPSLVEGTNTGSRADRIFSMQVTNAHGDEWKNLRTTFSPIFTSG